VAKRVGEHRIVPVAIVIIAAGLALIAASRSIPALALASGVLAMGMGFNSPSMLSAISQLADPRDQGSTLGVSQSLGSLARIVGPAWGGWVFDQFGIRLPFVAASAVMLAAARMSLTAFRGFERRPAAVSGDSPAS